MNISEKLKGIDRDKLTESMHQHGYAILQNILGESECEEIISKYDDEKLYRKTVIMERYRFGLGAYKYFNYPLPKLIETLRTEIYPLVAPIANSWMKVLNVPIDYPETHKELLKKCHENGQLKPTPLLLKYGKNGFNTLHQDLYGDIFFPIQLVLFLTEPGKDFTGGEFVLTQQNMRAQSKAIVLQPKKGDLLLFTTNFRPIQGTKGYYRAYMKHGVSEVHTGERYTLGIIFHDALT